MAARIRFDGGPASPQRSGAGHHLLPVGGILRHVGGVIELVELGGVFGHEAVRLDEIGEHVAARSVPADAPLDVEAALLDTAGAAHQPVDVRQLVGHVVERGAVVAEDRHAVVIRAAAQELHHVRAVGKLEAEHVDEKRHLVVGARAVEHDMADLGRPRAVEHGVGMLHAVGRDAHRQPVGRAEAEAVAAAGAAVERRRIVRHLDAVAFCLGAERLDRGAIRGGEVHAEQRRLRPLPDGQHMMLAAGGAEMNAVAAGGDLLERPDLGVELRRLMKIANAEFDAADAGNPGACHGNLLPRRAPRA